MKILYLDLGMGAAGDMLAASLYELLDEEGRNTFTDKMNSLGIDGLKVCAKKSIKCGITGTHMEVAVHGISEETGHCHEHEHNHTHDHHDPEHVTHVIDHIPLDEKVRENAKRVYDIIASAEGRAHGVPVSQIHFHEVGDKDAIADVTAVCLLMEMIGADKIISSPVCTGFGKVRCAHGILPVPAPATAYILEGIPVYAGDIEGEMCTPTGAALIKFFTDEYGQMPELKIDRTGYGMGQRDYEAANCVRAILGEAEGKTERVVTLSCNVDDMTGEEMGFATKKFFEEGALDVYTVNIGMKKTRPAVMINVICSLSDREKFIKLIFSHTTTSGIRENISDRYVLDRTIEEFRSDLGPVRIKKYSGYGISRSKFEYDDIEKIANEKNISIDEVTRIISRQIDDKA